MTQTPPTRRSFLATSAAVGAVALAGPALAQPAPQTPATPTPGVSHPMQTLKKYNVTIRRFNPEQGAGSGEDFVLPVDSPDEEHAAASTLANAASFTTKMSGGSPLPIAFMCTAITTRP